MQVILVALQIAHAVNRMRVDSAQARFCKPGPEMTVTLDLERFRAATKFATERGQRSSSEEACRCVSLQYVAAAGTCGGAQMVAGALH